MKSITKNSSLLLVLFMLAYTCAKEDSTSDTEEIIIDKDEVTFEHKKTVATATAEWKKFNTTAEKLLAITVSNLKSLSVMREKTLIVDEQESLFLLYTQSKNQYNELKSRLTRENLSFKKDIHNYNNQTEYRYRVFKNQFLTDILELNNNMEDILEEIQAGPMLP
ncbi:hypothetical protein [Flavobacterium sp. 102]|uniref:hypothetical protein n=1 Tax=Flavobacterium sp. 102 TaxID=2135623 RepID=UPI000EADD006|nr:hypothetical protein [Flavobacterium sp. 102]RKS03619.1 hypothetical protein C8C84_3380 [Flavobacterium sp. 102]